MSLIGNSKTVDFAEMETQFQIKHKFLKTAGFRLILAKTRFTVEKHEDESGAWQQRVTEPVLPMILSGLTMNFTLCEKDYGLAIARLYCRLNLQMKVVKSSL